MNEQFRHSSELLTGSSLFLNPILTSVTVAVVTLGEGLVVTSWNRAAENMLGLRTEEVEGEFFLNLDIGLPLGEIRDMLRRVVAGKSPHEETVVDATNRKGHNVRCRVLISPLVQASRRPQGAVVLTEETDIGQRPGFRWGRCRKERAGTAPGGWDFTSRRRPLSVPGTRCPKE